MQKELKMNWSQGVFMFKKFLLLIIILMFASTGAFAEKSYTLKAGIAMIDRVPKELYGTWRVKSTLVTTNNEQIFKKSTVDLWNLSRVGNVITLDNPFTGAKASVVIDEVRDKVIKFKKIGDYDGKKLSDVVQLELSGDRFSGENSLKLDTLSDIDKSVIKTDKATYKLSGEKISGASVK